MSDRKYRVLLTLMGLEIGGAETHVVELAKYLHREGHTVIVASNGGCYEAELLEYGIKHYKVPLHNKLLHNVLKSYSLLKNIIRQEDIELIHAHARIPAFICGILAKKLNIPFVTTAHWVFYTGFGIKYITNWGQRTISVSEEIKKYLIDNYGVPEKNISLTINGIDTDKFSPDAKAGDIIQEFGLSTDTKKIVYTGRLTRDRGEPALKLAEVVPELIKADSNLEVIIVGDGDLFKEINDKAQEVNRLLGKKYIHMIGGRTDINKFLALSDIYIGASRAALEAMACSKPAILAHNAGYLGIFTGEKIDIARESNFCCLGAEKVSNNRLAADITTLMNMSSEDCAALGYLGRSVVEKYYSARKMALDCIEVYDDIMNSGDVRK